MQIESKIFWCYVASSCFFIISLITSSLPWSHWAYNLNIFPGKNCECILFGQSFAEQFGGGKTVYCQLITFLQIPLFLTAAGLSFYQGKVCLIVKKEKKRLKYFNEKSEQNPILILKSSTLLSRNGRTLKEGDVIIEDRSVQLQPPSKKTNIIFLVISSICLLIVLSLYVSTVVGYQWSCNEYRKMLVRLLRASGNMAQIISERLECTAIFDFMDFLQPKRRLHDPTDYGRNYNINTGMSLFIAQLSLFKNLICWVYITKCHAQLFIKRKEYDRKQIEETQMLSRRR